MDRLKRENQLSIFVRKFGEKFVGIAGRHCCCHIHLPYAANKLLINKYQDRKVALHQKPVINLIKHFKIVIYDSKVVLTTNLPILRL